MNNNKILCHSRRVAESGGHRGEFPRTYRLEPGPIDLRKIKRGEEKGERKKRRGKRKEKRRG